MFIVPVQTKRGKNDQIISLCAVRGSFLLNRCRVLTFRLNTGSLRHCPNALPPIPNLDELDSRAPNLVRFSRVKFPKELTPRSVVSPPSSFSFSWLVPIISPSDFLPSFPLSSGDWFRTQDHWPSLRRSGLGGQGRFYSAHLDQCSLSY